MFGTGFRCTQISTQQRRCSRAFLDSERISDGYIECDLSFPDYSERNIAVVLT